MSSTEFLTSLLKREVKKFIAQLENLQKKRYLIVYSVDYEGCRTMSDYIDREKAIGAAKHAWGKGLEPSQYIEIIPAADVRPVVRGKWETITDPYGNIEGWIHRECGRTTKEMSAYCPTCGTKMILKGEK